MPSCDLAHDWAVCSCRMCQRQKARIERRNRTARLLKSSPERFRVLSHIEQMRDLGINCQCFDCQVDRVTRMQEEQKTCLTIR